MSTTLLLTEEQKDLIRQTFSKTTDLNELVRIAFNNPELDGRKKEGRLVRKFLIDEGLQFSTTERKAKDKIELTEENKNFILRKNGEGMSSLKIAEALFGKEVSPLSQEWRLVFDFLQESIGESRDIGDGELSDYSPPKADSRVVSKINEAAGLSLDLQKMNRQHQICVERLKSNLGNSRFIRIINNYTDKNDRELFEHEFIRLTWDKPDLSSDEINLYMNVCKEIINLEVISKHLNKLNKLFDETDGQQDFTMRLSDVIKAKSSEYNACENRIESLTKRLQGDRAARITNKTKQNASILAVVQAFQDEEERRNMVKMAEMQKQIVEKEADRIEGVAEWMGRILGISKEDII